MLSKKLDLYQKKKYIYIYIYIVFWGEKKPSLLTFDRSKHNIFKLDEEQPEIRFETK